jgi:hypothetical protein
VAAARERFIAEVMRPAFREPRGYARLEALCRGWVDYVERKVFPGGCFFAAAAFEFDGRPGPIRDAIAKAMDGWVEALETAITIARDEGHLREDVDVKQLAFELNSLFFGANFARELRTDMGALERALRAIENRLESVRGPRSPAEAGARSLSTSLGEGLGGHRADVGKRGRGSVASRRVTKRSDHGRT